MVSGMLQGLCGDTVDANPQKGNWWQTVVSAVHSQGGAPQDRSGSFKQRKGVPSGVEIRVGLDSRAGTQSAGQLIKKCGFL